LCRRSIVSVSRHTHNTRADERDTEREGERERERERGRERERDVVETYVSSISSAIPDSSFSIPGKQSSAVMPLMNVSSSLTVGGCDRASNRPVVDVLDAQYLRAGHKTLVNPGCPQPMPQLDKKVLNKGWLVG
jgi:hypothetical protein